MDGEPRDVGMSSTSSMEAGATDARPDPVEVYRKREERKRLEAELSAHRYTLGEVQEMEQAASRSVEESREYQALRPYIEASHSRGDWRHPYEMTRAEAQAYIESQGIEGPVWSSSEVRVICADPELYKLYGPALLEAQDEGRVISHPDALKKGRVVFFANETDAIRDAEVHRKLVDLDSRRAAHNTLVEAVEKLPHAKELGPKAVVVHAATALKKAWMDTTTAYPVDKMPGWQVLANELQALGATGGDLQALKAEGNRERWGMR